MTRYALKNNQKIPYTAEQEALADAEEQAWADGQADRDIAELRTERNRLLAETDYWTLSDTSDATDAQLAYRIALRNIPLTYTSLNDVVWPTKP
jgi:hypothetical protein